MEIRDARPGDAPALASLLDELGYPGAAGSIGRRVAELLAHPDAALLVAEEGGQVLGAISLHFVPQLALAGDFCRISYFCVGDGARGRGVGAELERRAVELARARGCDRLEVHCHERRARAHQFYARQGYVESPKYLMKLLGGAGRGHEAG
jgi:GNAT superfamily N-acetyltransferase